MAHWQLGHKEEAVALFDQAVDWTEKNSTTPGSNRNWRQEAERLIKTANQ
jgi:hypothetical protein